MNTLKRLFVVTLFLFSCSAWSGPKEDLSILHQQVSRSLASSHIKSVYHYMELECEQLMYEKTDDKFLKYLRNEIKLSIGKHFCELVEESPALQADVEYEAQRDYISMADYSKLVDVIYSSFHDKR